MKTRYYLSCYVVLISFLSFSQKINWEQTYGGHHDDILLDAVPTADYGFILAGSSLSKKTGNKAFDSNGDLDYWIWKMDESGKQEWQKSFGGTGSDLLQSIRLTADGGFILGGTSNSPEGKDKKETNRGDEDYWIIKLDAAGQEQWQRTYGGYGSDMLKAVIPTRDGGYFAAGSSASDQSGDKTYDSRGNMDVWVLKLDSKGAIEWQRTFGGKYADVLKSAIMTTDGGFLLGVYSNSHESGDRNAPHYGKGDYWVIKLGSNGDTEWQYSFGGEDDDRLEVVYQTRDGNYLIGGSSISGTTNTKSKTNKNGSDIWLLKADDKGTILWQQTYDLGENDILVSIIENEDESLLLGCYSKGNTNRKQKQGEYVDNYVAIRTDKDGDEKWRKKAGSKGQDVLTRAIETRDGGYLFAGTSKGSVSGDKNSSRGKHDFWVVKFLDEDKPKKEKEPVEAIPNPASEYTNIIVGFEFEQATLSLFDLGGRQLQQFTIDQRTVPVSLNGLPEGIYIVEVRSKEHQGSVKVMKRKN